MTTNKQGFHTETWLLTQAEKETTAARQAMLARLSEQDDEYRTRLRRSYGLDTPAVMAVIGTRRRV